MKYKKKVISVSGAVFIPGDVNHLEIHVLPTSESYEVKGPIELYNGGWETGTVEYIYNCGGASVLPPITPVIDGGVETG